MVDSDVKMGIVSLFVTVSVILSFLANISCSAVSFYSPLLGGTTMQFGVYSRKGTVPWFYGNDLYVSSACINYDGDDMNPDAKWKTAKAFTIFALVFGSLLPCVSCFMPNLYKPIGACMLLVCLFQGLTMLILDSNLCKNNSVINDINNEIPDIAADERFPTECSRDWGFNSNIACVVFWFVTAMIMITLPTSDNAGDMEEVPPQDEEASPDETELKEMDAEEPFQEDADVDDGSVEKSDP
eukprot:CAMPEP_0198302976 /NCGR_PEP_ID=MMETSP1449-20131203/56649_1 /TAXON_ID=420275 /ORGANISM="Attheya septentrionalis, Strain CCMP2084" /LENGTH=240 /DNA_ID=CAMNT_0044005455 /DNA_START=672 /DNA_END=1394 /DNA_ORIENTATION=-